MPLVLRTVTPVHVSRDAVDVRDGELDAVTNNTLSNVLRQLASLVVLASEIFEGLAEDLQDVHKRSCTLKSAIERVELRLGEYDPRTVTVPESDICTFSQRTTHYQQRQKLDTALFTTASRPVTVQRQYDAAAPTLVSSIRCLDRFRRDGTRSSKLFVCTPILQGRRKRWRKMDLDIETRKPTAVEELRRWTSSEAFGELTVLPDNTVTVEEQESPVDHLLPSPEEQMMAVALRFPPSIVPVDVSGRAFARLSSTRRSLTNIQSDAEPGTARRRRGRRRDKRRNTLAGTSHKEIEAAMAGETTATETEGVEFEPLPPLRTKSGELFKIKPNGPLKGHLETLKHWSRGKLRAIQRSSDISTSRPTFLASDIVDDVNVYVRDDPRRVEKAGSSTSVDTSITNSIVVKLRENALQRRHRRAGLSKGKEEPAHSSSGNWSASSESGRTSIASETTTAPKSTSATTSSNSLNHHHGAPSSVQSRRRVLASGSSSVSEGTLTPDICDVDGETSSVYSCDTEGYYTSFHVDSGLKTLKEEDIGLSGSSLRITDVTRDFPNFQPTTRAQMTAENEYELFGKGSTSTTTSSAGTVCTTLPAGVNLGSSRSLSGFAPAVPERKSSLDRKERTTMISVPDSPSPDSGHNTSSSPGDSTGQVESDLEGDRVERLRSKTEITTNRIPSMVTITPPISDEEFGPHAPLRIAIPDLYALPDKRRKEVMTVSNNGVLETNLDSVEESRAVLNVTVDRNTGYATINDTGKGLKHYTVERQVTAEKVSSITSPDYVSLNSIPSENSLERRRQGARVTLDSEGKVVYSSDSLKRKKDHSTFVPGKFVRQSPTPSPVPEHRTPKPVRPVNTSGLVKTNGDFGDRRNSDTPRHEDRKSPEGRKSPRLGKIFMRAPTRVVSPVTTKRSPSNSLERAKRNIVNINDHQKQEEERINTEIMKKLQNSKEDSRNFKNRCSPAPSTSSTSSTNTKRSSEYEEVNDDRWISQHPAASTRTTDATQVVSTSGFPRSHPMYWTLPARRSPPQQNSSKSPDGPLDLSMKKTEERFHSSTPTKETTRGLDLTISPITSPKATMTSEELFAAIHKSKKKLNLKLDDDSPSKVENRTGLSPAKTSIQNFKMLLLQRGGRDTGKMSAVEQLKLSKNGAKPVREEPQRCATPPRLGKKSQWRFAGVRSDVLSSTIPEDCSEVEGPVDAARYRREMESSPLLRRGRLDFDVSKPQRTVLESALSKSNTPLQRQLPEPPQFANSLGKPIPSTYEKITAPVTISPVKIQSAPTNKLNNESVSPKFKSTNSSNSSIKSFLKSEQKISIESTNDPKSDSYRKIATSVSRSPLKLNLKDTSPSKMSDSKPTGFLGSAKRALLEARREFFAQTPPVAVPSQKPARFGSKALIANSSSAVVSTSPKIANGVHNSSQNSALQTSNEKTVRSPNISLETAL